MVNLFDIARLAQSGAGMEAMSRQLALDPATTRRAVEALLPAFALAFQRSALDPATFADLTRAVGSGQYAPFYDPAPARPPEGGEGLLGLLFRNPDATRQVAAQAAALTGLGAQVFVQMMPTLAGTLVGGLSRYATMEGFADGLRQWADALHAASRSASPPPPSPSPLDPWSAWLDLARTMSTAAGLPAPFPASATAPHRPAAIEPPRPAGGDRPAGSDPAAIPNPFDALAQMFETGREVQAQHLANLKTILDAAWEPAPRR